MTKTALKKKVIDYINQADGNVLEVVYNMLRIYEEGDGKSLMNKSQKVEIDNRAELFKQGKIAASSWKEVKMRIVKAKKN